MTRYLWIALTAALAGCGGGGSESSSGSGSENNNITCEPARELFSSPTEKAAGVYLGYFEHIYETSTTREGTGILSPSGRLMFFANNGLVTGLFSLPAPSAVDGTSTFDGSVKLWSSEAAADSLPLNGYLTSQGGLSANCSSCDEARELLDPVRSYRFEAQYGKPTSNVCLSSVDASGSWSQSSGEETTTITIDANNSFTGSDSTGCIYSGALTDHRIEGGIMDINATVSNCSKAGEFIGVGSILGDSQGAAHFIFGALWSDSRVVVLSLEK